MTTFFQPPPPPSPQKKYKKVNGVLMNTFGGLLCESH